MAIPKYNELFPAFMLSLQDGKEHKLSEIYQYCAKYMNLTQADMQIQHVSGGSVFNNRVRWCRLYLIKAGLIDSPARATYIITKEGKKALANGAHNITLEYLEQIQSFSDFKASHAPSSSSSNVNTSISERIKDYSPQDLLNYALEEMHRTLADELMNEVLKVDAYDFEQLVVKLLQKMGYGTLQDTEDAVTKKSGDEGIDGIVTTDKFGFDSLYVQAKRWNKGTTVGRPEIQKFLGALAGQGATKGLFITTSKFSKEAEEFAKKHLHQKIVLIDGDALMKLMIEYELGVSTISVYKVRKLDTDFFNDEM